MKSNSVNLLCKPYFQCQEIFRSLPVLEIPGGYRNGQSGDVDFARVDSPSNLTRIFIPLESIHATRLVALQRELRLKITQKGLPLEQGLSVGLPLSHSLHLLVTELFLNYDRYFSWVNIFQVSRVSAYGTPDFPHLCASRGKQFTAVVFSFQAVALWTGHGWQACSFCSVRQYTHSLPRHQGLGIWWLDKELYGL